MNSIDELNNNFKNYVDEDSFKKSIVSAINKADTIEELLILKWHYRLVLHPKNNYEKKFNFKKKIESFSNKKALSNTKAIIDDIINDFTLEQIMQKYNITRQSIKKVVIEYLKSNNYNDVILDKLDIFKIPIVPDHDRELVKAVTAINMFINSECCTGRKIQSKFNCSFEEVYRYLAVLETNRHPLYDKYMSLYNKSIALNTSKRDEQYNFKKKAELNKILKSYTALNSKEVLNILSRPSSNEFKYFCLSYGFNTHILKEMLKDDESLMYKLSFNKSNIIEIYNHYVDKYKELAREVIGQIIMLNKNGFKEYIDLYDYYSKTKFDLKALARLASGSDDIKYNTIILQYIDKLAANFKEINNRTIATLRQKRIMSFGKESISFNNTDLVKAVESINDNDMPMQSGVLYYAIKRQVAKEKVKKKD